jgi:hypothetical protein
MYMSSPVNSEESAGQRRLGIAALAGHEHADQLVDRRRAASQPLEHTEVDRLLSYDEV